MKRVNRFVQNALFEVACGDMPNGSLVPRVPVELGSNADTSWRQYLALSEAIRDGINSRKLYSLFKSQSHNAKGLKFGLAPRPHDNLSGVNSRLHFGRWFREHPQVEVALLIKLSHFQILAIQAGDCGGGKVHSLDLLLGNRAAMEKQMALPQQELLSPCHEYELRAGGSTHPANSHAGMEFFNFLRNPYGWTKLATLAFN